MANKKISELQSRTPSLSDLMLVGDPSSGYSYKCTITTLATLIETDIADGYVTIGTTQTISGAKTFSNVLTLTSVANATTDPDKFLVLNGSNVVNYRTGSEVLSDIGGQGALTLTTTGTSGAATLIGNTLNIPQYQTALTNPVTGTGTTNYLAKFTSTSAIGNSIVFDDGTNVGISTTSPSYKLDVNGSARVNNTLHLAGTNVTNSIAANAGMILNSDGSTSSDRNFQFQIAGSEKMRLDNSGNLGIGTTSPEALLHVNKSNAGGEGGYIYVDNPASSTLNSSVGVRFGTSSGASFASVYTGEISNIITNASTGASALLFGTFNGSASGERMRIDASGNVGIGTTSPANILEVQRNQNATTSLNVINTDATNSSSRGRISTTGGAVIGAMNSISGNGLWLGSESNHDVILFTNSAEKARLTASGNVGIGTTSPEATLDLYNTSGVQLRLANSTTGTASTDGTRIYLSGSDLFIVNRESANIQLYTNDTERMRITSGGNVGIGTSSPAYKLSVLGSSLANMISWTDNVNNTGYLGIRSTAASIGADNNLLFETGSTERMRITSGGNVGIGTSSPTSISNYVALTINGTSGSFTEYQQGGSYAFRIGSDNSEGGFISQTTNNPIRIFTNSNERMRIKSSGVINLSNVPSSATGLATGDIYRDGDGYLLIVL